MNSIAKAVLNDRTGKKNFFIREPLLFDSADSGKTYDFGNVRLLSDCIPDAAVRIMDAENLTIRGFRIEGAGTAGIRIKNSRDVRILNCQLAGFDEGIVSAGGYGMLAEGCGISDCRIGVEIGTPGTIVQNCGLKGGEVGICAAFRKPELSAAMADGYNILAAQNKVTGYGVSLSFEGVSNGVVLLNDLERVNIHHGINIYLVKNRISEDLSLSGNDYLLANENRIGLLEERGNLNLNGDNVTDIRERAGTGCNENLLPHINAEQFVGMDCRRTVLSDREELFADYIRREAEESNTVILPPGVYLLEEELNLNGLKGKTIYAYGVLRKMTFSHRTAVVFQDSYETTLKGMFIAADRYPHIQGTVVACGKETYSFLADPGYHENFSDSAFFVDGAPGGIFRPADTSPCSESYFKSRSFDPATGVNRIDGSNFKECAVGYRVAHRNWKGAGGVCFLNCSGMQLEDVTVFCSSGFAEFDKNNEVAPRLHRFAIHRGPAPVLDQNGDYSRWDGMGLIHTDQYGRLRGPEPMNTTCDATHSTNARHGMVAVSCLFERMNDDGGNINAYYGSPVSFDPATNTLVYTFCKTYFERTRAKCIPLPFIAGDVLLLYGKNGRQIAKTSVTCNTEPVGEDLFAVRLSEPVFLPDNFNQIVLQNATASGTGFLWDNVMVRDSLSFGLRVQANAGTVQNCTFLNTAKGGIQAVPQYGYWPECGYLFDVTIRNNLFDCNSNLSGTCLDWSDGGFWLPLSIYTGDDLHHRAGSADADFCLHKNILIENNIFDRRYTRYAVYLSDISHLVMRKNQFLPRYGMTDKDDDQAPVWLAGGNNIRFESNSFPSAVKKPFRVDKEAVAGFRSN